MRQISANHFFFLPPPLKSRVVVVVVDAFALRLSLLSSKRSTAATLNAYRTMPPVTTMKSIPNPENSINK
jgi:hypothetical protein